MFSIISLTSATPVLLAASISTTSRLLSLVIDTQLEHTPQGSGSWGSICSQLTIFEIILASVVLPTPLVPEKINA